MSLTQWLTRSSPIVSMASGHERELQLGADAVGGGDQHRLAITLQQKAAAEAADVGQHAARERLTRQFADGADRAIGFVDVDARLPVTYCFFRRHNFITLDFAPVRRSLLARWETL